MFFDDDDDDDSILIWCASVTFLVVVCSCLFNVYCCRFGIINDYYYYYYWFHMFWTGTNFHSNCWFGPILSLDLPFDLYENASKLVFTEGRLVILSQNFTRKRKSVQTVVHLRIVDTLILWTVFQNIGSTFFWFVTVHMSDRETDKH